MPDIFALNKTYGVYYVISVFEKDLYKVECQECGKISIMSGCRLFRGMNHCNCKVDLKNVTDTIINNYKILYYDEVNSEIECQNCKSVKNVKTTDLIKKNIKKCKCTETTEVDIIGKKINMLLVLKKSKNKKSYYSTKCDCGKIKDIHELSLIEGKSISCGCHNNSTDIIILRNCKKKYVPGLKIDKLLLLENVSVYEGDTISKQWKVMCDCGNILTRSSSYLKDNRVKIKSCGCQNVKK